jgi:RNA polymerase sigma-54 factor
VHFLEDVKHARGIAALLKQRGFDCARRTVVKYRESMGIGSSVQRRRQRKISGLG